MIRVLSVVVCLAFMSLAPVCAALEPAAIAALKTDYDAYFAERMEALHIPGAVVAVVYQDALVFAQGYGHACVDPPQPVIAEETLFRIGSVTKVITATAAMYCVERDLLHLHGDINEYLDGWRVPSYPGGPITLWHLLTHTAGFDDRFLGLGARSPDALEPLGAYLQRRLPERVQPVGEVYNYSNFGIALAAHLVEAVSGQCFNEFVEAKLFQPLGMHPGGFDQPLPPEMQTRLAYTYAWDGARQVPSAWRDAASQVAPAGAYAVTATDMARFMIAHLQHGRHADQRILAADTVREMHTSQFTAHPELRQQQALGFHIREHNGVRLVWHTGRVDMFTAQLVLAPELGLGLFVALNADQGDKVRNDMVDILARHFFSEPVPDDVLLETAPPARLASVAGAYRQVRHVRHGFEKLGFIGQEIYFHPDAQGRLVETRFGARAPADIWAPVAGYDGRLFAAVDAEQPRRLVFVTDDRERREYACMDRRIYTVLTAYERLRWFEHTSAHLAAAAFCLSVFVIALIRWPVLALVYCFRERTIADTAAGHTARILGGLMSMLFLAFVIGLGLCIALTDMYLFAFGLPWRIRLLLPLPLMAAALWAGLVFIRYRMQRETRETRRWTFPVAAPMTTLVCIAGGLFMALLYYWNVLF